jgi:glycosyltransferase involved in cell wall biosynthesis
VPEARVSVLVAAFDADATIRETVESVLSQTVGELELIVADDHSRVPVREVLADIRDDRLRIVRRARNGGTARARNTALREARAPIVCQLDADDMWEPDFLEQMLPCFDDPAVGLAYANVRILGHPTGHEDYIFDPSVHPLDRFPKLADACPVPSPTATMRRLAVLSVGGYAPWLRSVEDWHLYMKLAAAGWRFAYVDRQLARYRWPQSERGKSHDSRRHERWRFLAMAGFAAANPSVRGPRRQAWMSMRRALSAPSVRGAHAVEGAPRTRARRTELPPAGPRRRSWRSRRSRR